MSRLAKNSIKIPKEVKFTFEKSVVHLKGPKGEASLKLPLGIAVELKDEKLMVNRLSDMKQNRANHGTFWALIGNMVMGVSQGHRRDLEIQGVGFRAQAQGQKLSLSVGFSHPVELTIPEGVKVTTPKPTEIVIEGTNIALVGDVAAKIRKIKPPEPYKGKGIRYQGELVRRKQGKSVTK